MLIWFILFLIVITISFVLAYQSMSDYEEQPLKLGKEYALFLIQKPQNLNIEMLKKIHQTLLPERLILSFERLFKGSKKALVVFGPSHLLRPFSESLGLLELEDYSQERKVGENFSAWEMGMKKLGEETKTEITAEELPVLGDNEEFWWQVVLKPLASKENLEFSDQIIQAILGGSKKGDLTHNFSFKAIARVVAQAGDRKKLGELQESLSKVGRNLGLVPLPQVYSSSQILKFYQQRTLPEGGHLRRTKGVAMTIDILGVKSLLIVR